MLPIVRGRIREKASLAATTWFQVGGEAEYLFKPADTQDLAHFLQQKPKDLPVTIIGVGSNLLVRDGGIDGVVVRLGRGFTHIEVSTLPEENEVITVGAACLDLHVARYAAEQGIAGLEFLSGIPGTIGGAVAMNAGAYSREIKDVLLEVEVVTQQGQIARLNPNDLRMTYRHAELPEGAVVTHVTLRGEPGDSVAIQRCLNEIQQQREDTQPIRERTGGSTFKNPTDTKAQDNTLQYKKAWELVDAAGCRGLTLGGAKVSEKHCNFLINTGEATAADLEKLGDEVRERVKAHSGVELEWEIKRVGKYE